ncbi:MULTISPECIES: bifunctional nicotinamidase/pyrazinamidase [unclassified Halanaerobium]|uniref:bifunctional nicotinamidase/pyrazinamidase n=1 Tax=unclassified Halanaerobium TaxID=2641197 RepID=UPI000DF4C005|nr:MULTISPECIES: bifunctional nicotinamidase/pyrazinamidase [unclassified Halanaerobium]RCW51536.1 nicotinamidase/pyrazinamidase [Halanaerobium sp. MA284_MarDTE_T2]RCW89324.1 nicotinamidase/pyrazinamidase [Halanaerobium sp. DL-01]
MRKALLLVDLQNDFYENGNLAVSEASKINPAVNKLLSNNSYNIVIASQDWHPAGHRSFASTHNMEAFTPYEKEKGIGPVLWPDHCIQGTYGADFHPDIDSNKFDYILRKGTENDVDSYSAFQDNDGTDLGLNGLLKGLNIKEIDICGLAFDVCVKYTALDAVNNNFKTNIFLPAVKAVDKKNFNQHADDLKENGVNLKREV